MYRVVETVVSASGATARAWQLCRYDSRRKYLYVSSPIASTAYVTTSPNATPARGLRMYSNFQQVEIRYDGYGALVWQAWYFDFGTGPSGTVDVNVVEGYDDEDEGPMPPQLAIRAAELAVPGQISPAAARVDDALRKRFRDMLATHPVFNGV